MKSIKKPIPYIIGLSLITLFWVFSLKFNSVSFHRNDFGYYWEFLLKYMSNDYDQNFTVNPEGRNFLDIVATDGTESMMQNIHFEPVKFIELAIFKIFKSVYSIAALRFLFLILLFLTLRKTKISLWVALFIFFSGSTLNLFLYDIRTYYYIPLVFLGMFLTWKYNRKYFIYFYILGFLVREEFLILNLFFFAYIVINDLTYDKPQTRLYYRLIAIWDLFTLCTLLYFYYWYENEAISKFTILLALIFITLNSYFLLSGLINKILKWILNFYHKFFPKIPIDIFLFVPLFYVIFRSSYLIGAIKAKDLEWIKSALFLEGFNTLLYYVIFMIIVLYTVKNGKNLILKTYVILNILYFIVLYSSKISDFYPIKNRRNEVMEVYHKNVKEDTRLFTDYGTFQVFIEHKDLYNYMRLPARFFDDYSKRFFPDNMIVLEKLLTPGSVFILDKNQEENGAFLDSVSYNLLSESDYFVAGKIVEED